MKNSSMNTHMGSITIEALTDSEYTSAEEYLKNTCDEFMNKESDVEREMIEEVSETEILGYDGYRAIYEKDAFGSLPIYNYTHYAFDKDGLIYSIKIVVVDLDGQENVQDDFEKLIDCIKIK